MEFDTPQGRLDQLHGALKEGRGPVLVVMHDYPDPDCIASALGIQRLLNSWQIEADIGHGGGLGRPGNKAMVGLLDIDLRVFSDLRLEHYRGAVLVDTQPGVGNNSLPEGIPVAAVLDNHTLAADIDAPLTDVRTDCSATSSMVLEYLETAGVEIPISLATALFLGIKTDTEGLEREATAMDVDAYVRLLPKVDLDLVNKISRPPLTDDYFSMLEATLADACRFGEAAVANLGPVPVPDLLSAMSELLVQAKNAAWALVLGWHEGRLYVSLRIRPPRKNAASIMRKSLPPAGRGGGHARAAGGQVTPDDGDCERAARETVDRFLQAVGMEHEPPRQLCPHKRRRHRTISLRKEAE